VAREGRGIAVPRIRLWFPGRNVVGRYRERRILRRRSGGPLAQLTCGRQQDEDGTDEAKHSRCDQQAFAFVRQVNCHDCHDSGMCNIQPCSERDHASIRRRITRCQQQENSHHDVEAKPHRLCVLLIRLPAATDGRNQRVDCSRKCQSEQDQQNSQHLVPVHGALQLDQIFKAARKRGHGVHGTAKSGTFVEYPAEMLGADIEQVNGRATAPLERSTGSMRKLRRANRQSSIQSGAKSLTVLATMINDQFGDDESPDRPVITISEVLRRGTVFVRLIGKPFHSTLEQVGVLSSYAEHPGRSTKKARGEMTERKLSIPEIILIAGTRVALGAGIGLLLSGRLNKDQRQAAGLALTLVGALTTIPLAMSIMGQKSENGLKRVA